MSRKPLLSESQVAKWMKLANIDKNATKNFLNESKSNKKVLKENYGSMGAREDEDMGMEDGMGMGEEEEGGMSNEILKLIYNRSFVTMFPFIDIIKKMYLDNDGLLG